MPITLLTDFGTVDYFAAAMRGAILSVNPSASIFDITHENPAHDIQAAAFTLLAAYEAFPAGTIHVCVVDPGVGSARRPILVESRRYSFVGPDNGLFSYIYERETKVRVFHLTNPEYFRPLVSTTFHGRDVFAPVAGALSNGITPETLGAPITDYVRLAPLAPTAEDGILAASIIHIDRFGNCITNISPNELTTEQVAGGARVVVAGREIDQFRRYFSEEGSLPGELFAIWGSAGLLEIAAFCDSAARLLGVRRGDRVSVINDKKS